MRSKRKSGRSNINVMISRYQGARSLFFLDVRYLGIVRALDIGTLERVH